MLALLLAVPVAGLGGMVPVGASPGAVTTYTDPSLSSPGGITTGPDGALWFTNNTSIGRISLAGKITDYSGPGISDPRFITAGPDGALWFTNEGADFGGSIGRITTSGVVTNYTDPTISAPIGITVGPDGALWFTNLGDANVGDFGSIGRISTSGIVTNYRDPSIDGPIGIATGSDGALWFTNEYGNSIGRISTSGVVTNYTDPNIREPGFITAGPDGALWFTNDSVKDYSIGRITTTGIVTKFTAPGIALPFDIATGPDGAVWFTNLQGEIGRVTTSGAITMYTAPTVAGPEGITAGPDGSMWFTTSGNGESIPTSIGRITTSVDATPTWTIVPSPDGSREESALADVSCVSANWCAAVGDSYSIGGAPSRNLIELWNGHAWSVAPSPNSGQNDYNTLSGVSCISTTSCKAVGTASDPAAARSQSIIESWNGRVWSIVASSDPGARNDGLDGVSCVSSISCQAVGSYSKGSKGLLTLVESWNGKAWSVVPSPNPGTGIDELSGVSCVAKSSCTAVGYSLTTSGQPNRTLVESWNGHKWSFVSSPNLGAFSYVTRVSCTSVSSCKAVGSYLTSANRSVTEVKTLILSWNGHVWSTMASPEPASPPGVLEGVSCVSARSCEAVGREGDETLIESWNGTAWSIASSPSQGNNDGLTSNELSGVSCVSATSCQAVGLFDDSDTETLVESFG